jgi:triacylglycerol esterase/lipase EstA (alpha/beta hydrolase family)
VSGALRIVEGLMAALIAGSVAFNVAAYAGAAVQRRRFARPCPLDDEEVPPWPARALSWLRTFATECAATALVTASAPLAFGRQSVRRLDDGDARRPVILLHGYGQHTANFLWLVRRLRRDGWLHLYGVRHTAMWGDIERSAERLQDAVDVVLRRSGASHVDIVAHSMGGLVARAYVRRRGAGSRVARLITLGTPHRGTQALRWLALDSMVGQMRPGSALLDRLAADDPVPTLTDCTSIYSADDALVVPSDGAYYPGAFNIEVRGLGHLALLFSPRVYELVRENLAAALDDAPVAGSTRWRSGR